MKIIVVGAGNVGYTCAHVLSKFHNVMVIDKDKLVVDNIKSLLNVSVLYEDGSSPKTLQDAFARHSPDVVISATGRDEDNLFIAMISKYIKPGTMTIATIRGADFMLDTSEKVVDKILSPEMMIADKVSHLALLENSIDYDDIQSMKMALVTFEVTAEHTNIVGKVVINLDIPDDCTIVNIYRGDDIIVDCETTEIHPGDKITVLGTPASIEKFNIMIGVLREASEFVVIGGGVSGAETARKLEHRKKYIKIFEHNVDRCGKLARDLGNVIIVNGSGVDPHLLKSENVGRADVLMAMTNQDETNLLSCLMGMKLGSSKIISRYSMLEYEDIFDFTGIKTTVGTHRIVANEITKMLVPDEESILEMKRYGERFFMMTVGEKSKARNQHMGDIRLPEGARITCIIRDGENIFPRMDTDIRVGDKLAIFTYNVSISKLEKLFGHSRLEDLDKLL